MTAGRNDLARAFDEMIANMDYIRFQRLAIQLARNIWPDIIASEPGKDLGADGKVPSSVASDGVGKVLACSITPTYAKILADARKVEIHFPDLRVLIFATPAAVSNQRAAGWAQQLKQETGLELIVMSREDLISRLQDPANVGARQSLLGLAGISHTDFERICSDVAHAAAENATLWFAHRRIDSHPPLSLRFAAIEKDGKISERLDFPRITELLSRGGRLLLEAPPGGGKTTTLIQVARFFAEHHVIPLLVHLPEWASSTHAGLSDFVANSGPFLKRSILPAEVLQVIQQRPSVVLLNGWNELSREKLDLVEQRIQTEDRQLPQTGFLVATRVHQFKPPIQRLSRITILELNKSERSAYLIEALGQAGAALANDLDSDRALDDLTRTPFILHEVMKLHSVGHKLPSTKMGILAEVTALFEETSDHRNALLREPLSGMAGAYLSALAEEMTRRGDTIMNDQAARVTCSAVSKHLVDHGQIEHAANPSEILGALADHHVLERPSQSAQSFQFEHQQFQEFYAARALDEVLNIATSDVRRTRSYQRDYVDWPQWEQPLRMLAENIGLECENAPGKAAEKAKLLVGMAAEIDLFFAGTLARLCDEALPKDVRAALMGRLRRWYAIPDEEHQEMALAAIFETGFPEFADLVVPLLISHDQQTRLRAYRSALEFRTSILGGDWKTIVPAWEQESRREFISELTVHGGRTDIAEYFATEDPSMDIRKSSIMFLGWMENTEKLVRSIQALPAAERGSVLAQLHTEEIPALFLPEARAAHEQRLAAETDHVRRIQLILLRRELGIPDYVTSLKEELEKGGAQGFTHLNNRILGEALTLIKGSDEKWVSSWIASQITMSVLDYRTWGGLLTELSDDVQKELLATISSVDLTHNSDPISVLASVAGVQRIMDAFETYCRVKGQLRQENPQFGDIRFAVARQLEKLLRSVPAAIAVQAVSPVFDLPVEEHTLRCVTDLLHGVGRWNSDDGQPLDLRPELSEELRRLLRFYLKQAVPFSCALQDFDGGLVAHLSSVLSRVGDPDDLVNLSQLVNADISRWNSMLQARAAGQRIQARGWAMWHVRALLSLGSERADEALIRLLDESHYCVEAAKGLLEMARVEQPTPKPFAQPNFNHIWLAREGEAVAQFEELRRQRYSAAIRSQVELMLGEVRAMEHPENNSQALQQLAGTLAQLDGVGSAVLVCDAVVLASKWNSWARVDALRQILFSGGSVPFEATNSVLQDVIAEVAPSGYYQDDQGRSLVTSLLCLLPFTDNPEQGVNRIREVLAGGHIRGYQVRDVISALGYSHAPGALALLVDISGSGSPNLGSVPREWIAAVGNIGGRGAAEVLLAFVESQQDPEVHRPPYESYDNLELVASKLGELARSDDELKTRILQLANTPGTSERDNILSKAIIGMNSLDALLSTLYLNRGPRSNQLPYDLLEAFQERCLIKRRTSPLSSSYTLEARPASDLRRRLIEIAIMGDQRSWASFSLLGRIDVWRLRHSKPLGEPRHPYIKCGLNWPSLELFEGSN